MLDTRAHDPLSVALETRAAKVLLVEDDPASRRLLARALEHLGFEIVTATDGPQALRAIEAAVPDVVLLDFEMPGLNGEEVCQRIRASEEIAVRELPVIMLTAHSGEAEEIGCLQAGANDFVTKPVSRAVLEARIQTQLRLSALTGEMRAQNEQLARWQAAHEADLTAARTTQQGLIPARPPTVPGWNVETYYQPVIQVGGDVFGWRSLGSGRWLFWLADATGHGAAAALFTTLAALLFRHACEEHREPGAILDSVNREFTEVFRGRSFMTACCAVLTEDGRFACAGAGHPPILVRRADGSVEARGPHDTVLGLRAAFGREQSQTTLSMGDCALLYSDGLFSLTGEDGERFTHLDVQRATASAQSSERIIDQITAWFSARSKAGRCEDDVAAVALLRTE